VSLPPVDPQLLSAVRRGDRAASERLAAGIVPVVLRWCTHLVGPRLDPEDVCHDVLVQVLTRVDSLRDPVAFPAWLYQVTRREIGRQQRRRWLRDLLPGFLEDVPVPPPVHDDLARRVQAALDALPFAMREVLVLCDMEERPHDEVAALLGIPLGTVKSRLHRARRRFEADARAFDLAPDALTDGSTP
jgi:RNA polymerase sigma factor (sigma-70 family)